MIASIKYVFMYLPSFPTSLSICWALPCSFSLFLPPCLFISSFLCIPSLYIITLFLDSVFKYWGHPGAAQRSVVCSGGQSAARTSPSSCTGARVPAVCKCMTHTETHIKQQRVTHIYKHMDTHVGEDAFTNSSFMQQYTHKLFSWATHDHRCREGVQSLLWKYPLYFSLSYMKHVHTNRLPPALFLSSFPKQTCILSGKKSLSSLFISLCKSLSLPSPSFCPSIPPSQRFLSALRPTTPSAPVPSVWTCLAPGNKQRRVCVRGGRDGVSLSEGTMLLLVALNLQLLLSCSVCLSLINYLQFTFTEAHKTSARYSTISLQHQPVGQGCRAPLD